LKILILADYSSETPGGAQIIAELFSDSLRKQKFDVFELNSKTELIENTFIHKLFARSNFLRELRSIINPVALITLRKNIKKFAPDVIWIHNVNDYWSWSSLLVSRLSSKTILTCHDLSAISNLKMMKNHFNSNLKIDYKCLNMSKATIMLLRFKHIYLRVLFKKVSTIAIGEICQEVLEANNFQISSRIPNRVEICSHRYSQPREPNSVLFAGRLIGKGLRETAMGVEQAGMQLFLIGPPELYLEAQNYCQIEKIRYLGINPNQELLRLLHNFEIVSVCSQYFDNYPTIGLEALAHGCKLVTSELTGLSKLLLRHGVHTTIQVGEIPDFRAIQKIPIKLFNNKKLLEEITDPSKTIDSYLEVIN